MLLHANFAVNRFIYSHICSVDSQYQNYHMLLVLYENIDPPAMTIKVAPAHWTAPSGIILVQSIVFNDHIKQDACLAFQTGGCLLLHESSVESSCMSFLHYFHSAISSHLSIAISMSPGWWSL